MKKISYFCFLILGACVDESLITKKAIDKEQITLQSNSQVTAQGRVKAVQYYTDWSGQIEAIVVDQAVGNNQKNYGGVAVPSEYVLVGGGAYTTNTETNGGGYLTESRPDWENNTWIAASKDHVVADYHTLIIYAVGIKIQGVSPATLRSVMTAVKSPLSTLTNHPSKSVYVSPPYVLIGGGARVNYGTGPGNLLVYSYPSYNYWNVGSNSTHPGNEIDFRS